MFRRLALAASIAFGLPVGAHAATLYTSFLNVGAGDALNCGVVNASTKTLEVTLEVLGISGTVISGGPITLAPGAGAGQASLAAESPTHCRFTVKGSAKTIRGRACVLTPGGSCFVAVPAQ
jgi:hypothetical protein